MRISDIEIHHITPPYQDFNAEVLYRVHGDTRNCRTVIVAKTDGGP